MKKESRKTVNELKAGAILSYVNLALSCIIPLVYTPIMLRLLGQSEYGLYSIANSVISYLSLLSFGMGTAVIRYVTMYRAQNDVQGVERTAGTFVKIYAFLALLVCLTGVFLTFISGNVFSEGLSTTEISRLRILICIMTISVAASFLTSVFASVVIAYEKYIFSKLLDIASTAILPVINLFILYLGRGSIGLAFVGLLFQITYLLIFILYCTSRLKIRPRFAKAPEGFLREVWSFSAFVFLSSIVDLLYWSTDKVLIGARLGTAATAVYNIGGTFTSMLQNMSGAISNVFGTRVTTMVVTKKTPHELSDLLIRIGRLQYLVISLILSGYIVFGQVFIYFWAGENYQDTYWVALVTMIPLSIPLIENIAYNVIVAQNKHQFRAIIYVIIAIANIISTYLILPVFGIIGAAVCTGIAFLVGNGIVMNFYYARVTKLEIYRFWKNILRMSIVPVVLIIIGLPLVSKLFKPANLFAFLIEVVIYTIIFCISSWCVSMNNYEKNLIKELIGKIRR